MGVPDSCLSVAAAAVSRSRAKLVRAPIVRCCAAPSQAARWLLCAFPSAATFAGGGRRALFQAMRGGSRVAAVEAAARVWRSAERPSFASTRARHETHVSKTLRADETARVHTRRRQIRPKRFVRCQTRGFSWTTSALKTARRMPRRQECWQSWQHALVCQYTRSLLLHCFLALAGACPAA